MRALIQSWKSIGSDLEQNVAEKLAGMATRSVIDTKLDYVAEALRSLGDPPGVSTAPRN
jgi:hypothetical protein